VVKSNEDHATESATITLLTGDNTQQTVDAIVNARTHPLLAVEEWMELSIAPVDLRSLKECRQTLPPSAPEWQEWTAPPEKLSLQTAGQLNASHVIHTVGPRSGRVAEQ